MLIFEGFSSLSFVDFDSCLSVVFLVFLVVLVDVCFFLFIAGVPCTYLLSSAAASHWDAVAKQFAQLLEKS